ncbi:MAG TPA: dihydropteroate synthase [Thermoanaerobaculia bacterium]
MTPRVMGIINVTPDSFSDGGVHFDRDVAIESALRMVEDGAAIVDVGGESTRPGAEPIAIDEEIGRVIPVIEGIRAKSDVAISIDTRNAATARAAFGAGAGILNDVSALQHDPEMLGAAVDANAAVILMHMRGTPSTMQSLAKYDDVIDDVLRELASPVERARHAGIDQVFIDPGIGFAKTFEHNLEILARCDELTQVAPVVIGASRKKFIGHLTGREGRERVYGSLAPVAAAVLGGASIIRVHDVRETVDFLKVFTAIQRAAHSARRAGETA